jgi:hypothetical protein
MNGNEGSGKRKLRNIQRRRVLKASALAVATAGA